MTQFAALTDDVSGLPVVPAGTDTGSGRGPAFVVDQGVRGGEDINADVQNISDRGIPVYIATATTTLCLTGRGVLKRIVLTEAAAGTITVYDNITGAGTILAVIKASASEQTFEMGFDFATGCTIVTAAATKLTAVVGR